MRAIWTYYGFIFDADTAIKGIRNTVPHSVFMEMWKGTEK